LKRSVTFKDYRGGGHTKIVNRAGGRDKHSTNTKN